MIKNAIFWIMIIATNNRDNKYKAALNNITVNVLHRKHDSSKLKIPKGD